ncbi:MAG: penicillin acylase family protein [Actinomycetes bacterium]
MPRRRPALLAAVAAIAVAAPPLAAVPAQAQEAGPSAQVIRTSYGIPHITADDFESLAFGQAFAAAEDIACSLADTLLTARGERSRWFGPDERYTDEVTLSATNLQVDAFAKGLRQRQVVEELLADDVRGPSAEMREMVRGYVAGVNAYLADVGGAAGITDPACRGAGWVQQAEEIDLYYGIYFANLLASAGVFVPQIVGADPPTADEPGIPDIPVSAASVDRDAVLTALGRDPDEPFGSNGTALGGDATTTGRGMVLGNPHFPWNGRYRFTQTHLRIPGEYEVAGGMLHGSPVVNIGWTEGVAWTHTVSTAYRFTPYEFQLVPGAPTRYLTPEGPKELERDVVEVVVRNEDGSLSTVEEDLYRTHLGYVIEAPEIFLTWSPAQVWALRDANAEHLKTLDVFHEMAKARTVGELAEAQDRTAGLPWVNTMAADSGGDALYADNSVVPNVPDELVERCATAVGRVLFELARLPGLSGTLPDCDWRDDADAARPGIFGPANLPDTTRRDWVVNANDSYWLPNPEQPLEGFDRIIGCEQCVRSLRTRMVYRYVMDRLAGSDGFGGPDLFTHEQLQRIQHENRVFAAELAREGDDLQDVCTAAGGGAACTVLAGWDGQDDVDSVGAHVFREFWLRTPSDRWEVPFSADDPVGTPRDLDEGNADVVAAMEEAIAFLQDEGIPFDAPLGSLQKAGDPGAPDVGLGGGPGGTGNASVLSTDERADTDALYGIWYGSSHIQAVAFDDDGVDAATILTYGQSVDPTRASSGDQTRLFGQERWVDFAFERDEVLDDAQECYVVDPGGRTDVSCAAIAAAERGGATPPVQARATLPATGPAALVPLAGLALAVGGLALRRRRTATR